MSTLWTTREVATMIGVSAETVLRWTRRGEIPAIRLPSGALRYRPSAVESWLTVHETLPTRATARRETGPNAQAIQGQ